MPVKGASVFVPAGYVILPIADDPVTKHSPSDEAPKRGGKVPAPPPEDPKQFSALIFPRMVPASFDPIHPAVTRYLFTVVPAFMKANRTSALRDNSSL